MAERRPIVLRSGRLTELPVGDSLPGAGFDPSALPLADALAGTESTLVVQDGVTKRAPAAAFVGPQGPEGPRGTEGLSGGESLRKLRMQLMLGLLP